MKAQQRVGTRALRNQQQRLVQRRHEEDQYPDRDAERNPYQQAGDQIAFHGREVRRACGSQAPAAGVLLAAGAGVAGAVGLLSVALTPSAGASALAASVLAASVLAAGL